MMLWRLLKWQQCLEYYTNLVDEKAAARFERTDSNFEKNSLKTQMLDSIF